MIPYAIELFVIISVIGFGCPIRFIVVPIAYSYLVLYNNDPYSASTANNITLRLIVDVTIIAPVGRLILLVAPSM